MKKSKIIINFAPAIAVVLTVILALQFNIVSVHSDKSGSDKDSNSIGTKISAKKSKTKKKKIKRSGNVKKATGKKTASSGAAPTRSKTTDLKNKTFKDGKYFGSAKGFRGPVKVQVKIKSGKIKAVSVVSSSDDAPYFNRAKGVIGKVLRSQSTNVDTVSGATYSSNGILGAIDVALKKAVIKNSKNAKKHIKKHSRGGKKQRKRINSGLKKPVPPKQKVPEYTGKGLYKNGTYSASSKKFYTHDGTATVTIDGGKIIDIKVTSEDENSENGISLANQRHYFKTAVEGLVPLIIRQQKTSGINTITGATFSSEGILESVAKALEKALIR